MKHLIGVTQAKQPSAPLLRIRESPYVIETTLHYRSVLTNSASG